MVCEALATFLRSQSEAIRGAGLGMLHGMVHALLGAVVGVMLSFESGLPAHPIGRRIATMAQELVRAFRGGARCAGQDLRRQRVADGVFPLGVMPLLGLALPCRRPWWRLTFIVGLVPVLGNLLEYRDHAGRIACVAGGGSCRAGLPGAGASSNISSMPASSAAKSAHGRGVTAGDAGGGSRVRRGRVDRGAGVLVWLRDLLAGAGDNSALPAAS